MSKTWPKVKLGEVLTERREVPNGEDLTLGKIPIVAKIGFNDGKIQFRSGGETKTGMILVHPGDLLVSGINASKGAISIYEKDNDALAAATIHYGAYIPNKSRVETSFLWWLLRSNTFRELLLEYVPGGIKTELKAKRFLPIPVPLPPLPEQKRIVARIEQLAAKIEEARRLRRKTVEETEGLCRAVLAADQDAVPTRIRDLLRLREPDVIVHPEDEYQFAGVYSFGRGVFRAQMRSGMEFAYPRLTRLRAGDFVYPKLMAWEGALGVVPPECDGYVVSTEFPVFEIDVTRVLPDVLDIYFRTPSVWPDISGASMGTNVRRRRLNPEAFLNYKMPLPSMATQVRLREVRNRLQEFQRLNAKSHAEIDALLLSVLDKAFKGEL